MCLSLFSMINQLIEMAAKPMEHARAGFWAEQPVRTLWVASGVEAATLPSLRPIPECHHPNLARSGFNPSKRSAHALTLVWHLAEPALPGMDRGGAGLEEPQISTRNPPIPERASWVQCTRAIDRARLPDGFVPLPVLHQLPPHPVSHGGRKWTMLACSTA